MNRFVGRYVAFDHCRAVLPWFEFARGRTPFARARRFALERENALAGRGRPNPLVAFFLYVPNSLRQVWLALRAHATPVRRDFALSYGRQLADLLYCAWQLNHAPHDYYLQKLWLRPRRADWAQFLSQREHVMLVKQLEPALPLPEFDDKRELHGRLQAAGIPTIEVLLAVVDGAALPDYPAAQDEALLRRDLVIKPTNGTMYEGVEVWRYDARENSYSGPPHTRLNGIRHPIADAPLDLPHLLARVRHLSQGRTYVIQPRMKNQPALEAISPHAIANFRIVTTSRGGKFQAIAGLLRMSYDLKRHIPATYAANVDVGTGVLGMATGCLPEWGYGRSHVDTGAAVTGQRIASWPELLALALRAHALFPWMPSIGWDVIATTEGPMIMEANAFWGANISQVDAPFLGELGYAEAYWEAWQRVRKGAVRPQQSAGSRLSS